MVCLKAEIRHRSVQREDHVMTQSKKMAIYKPKRKALGEINPTDALTWDFWSSELFLQALSLWYLLQ